MRNNTKESANMKTNRRSFIKGAGISGAAALGALAISKQAEAGPASQTDFQVGDEVIVTARTHRKPGIRKGRIYRITTVSNKTVKQRTHYYLDTFGHRWVFGARNLLLHKRASGVDARTSTVVSTWDNSYRLSILHLSEDELNAINSESQHERLEVCKGGEWTPVETTHVKELTAEIMEERARQGIFYANDKQLQKG